jgi:acyl-CoA dehydrogenase
MIKALVSRLRTTAIDRAIQTFGAMGLSPDLPLANLWTLGRALRLADRSDEMHLQASHRRRLGARLVSRHRSSIFSWDRAGAGTARLNSLSTVRGVRWF